jgi:hypothetical protein
MSSKHACALIVVLASMSPLGAQTLEKPTAAPKRFYADDPLWRDDDMRNIPEPAEQDLSKSYDFLSNTFGKTARSHGPALNVNTLGEVPDSSWFTNRLGVREMTTEEILRGPSTVDGPAPGAWQVTGRPDAGITPKFTIRDARGDIYLIKLDPLSNAELPSSVEVISTKIFHAIGYHVPEDFLVSFDLDRLTIAPGAKARTFNGKRKPIERADLERWLRDVPRQDDGTIRALASRYVPGKVVGQFLYAGRRSDDANDIYPHERRRELRGMRVFAAWLNHDDARALNSIDSYVDDGGRKYIRHYLQDFGSNLGSGSTSAQQPRGGYEYLIERREILKGLGGLGFYTRPWMRAKFSHDPSVGNIEADVFDPATWKTEYPQPAFSEMDAADAFWAGSILARFSNAMIRSLVEEARLSNPSATSYVADVMIRRRDKVLRWALTQTNPLDRFAVEERSLVFDNAARRIGVPVNARYQVQWSAFDNQTGSAQAVGEAATVSDMTIAVPGAAWGPADAAGIRYATASIATIDPGFPHWSRPVVVTIRDRGGMLDIVGIERPH